MDVRTSNADGGPPDVTPSALLERKSVQDLLKTLATSNTGLFPWKSMMQPRGEKAMPPPGAGSAAGTSSRENAQHNDSSTGMQSFLEMLTSQLSSGLSLKPRGGRTTQRDNQAGPSTGAATAQPAPAQQTAGASPAPPLKPQQQSLDPKNLATLDSMVLLPEMSALLGALVPSTGSATLPVLASVNDSGAPNLPGHNALAATMQLQQQQPQRGHSPSVQPPSGVSGAAGDAHSSGGGAGLAALAASAGGAGTDPGSVLGAMLRDGSMAEPLKMAW